MSKEKIKSRWLFFGKDKYTYDTIDELVNKSMGLAVGEVVTLNGYYSADDGATHKRVIADTDDGSGVELRSGKWANIVHNGEVNVSWFGAKGDGVFDNTEIFKKVIGLSSSKKIKILIPFGKYIVSYIDLKEKDYCCLSGVSDTREEFPVIIFSGNKMYDWFVRCSDIKLASERTTRGLCLENIFFLNNTETNLETGILCHGVTFSNFENVMCNGNFNNGIEIGHAWNNNWRDISVRRCKKSGIKIGHAIGNTNCLTIENLHVSSTGGSSIVSPEYIGHVVVMETNSTLLITPTLEGDNGSENTVFAVGTDCKSLTVINPHIEGTCNLIKNIHGGMTVPYVNINIQGGTMQPNYTVGKNSRFIDVINRPTTKTEYFFNNITISDFLISGAVKNKDWFNMEYVHRGNFDINFSKGWIKQGLTLEEMQYRFFNFGEMCKHNITRDNSINGVITDQRGYNARIYNKTLRRFSIESERLGYLKDTVEFDLNNITNEVIKSMVIKVNTLDRVWADSVETEEFIIFIPENKTNIKTKVIYKNTRTEGLQNYTVTFNPDTNVLALKSSNTLTGCSFWLDVLYTI